MEPITKTTCWTPFADCLESNPDIRIEIKFIVDPSFSDDKICLSPGNAALRTEVEGTFTAMCGWKDLTYVIDPLNCKITHQFIKVIKTADGTPLLYALPRREDYELDEMGPSSPRPSQVERGFVNGINLEFRITGSGPLVVMLHGLFDTNAGFHDQIEALAEDYTVAAPNLPGFGLSDKLKTKPTLEAVADTMAAFVEGLSDKKATIIGHGYGGTLAWVMAYRHPELIESIISINGPHPVDFAKKMASSLQLFRSWPFFLFQIPYLPQWILKANDGYLLKAMIRSWSDKPHTLNLDEMTKELLKPGVLESALQYYKAALRNFHPCSTSPYAGKVTVPVKIIWGEKNHYLGVNLAKDPPIYTNWIRRKLIPNAGHWLTYEASGTLTRELKDMLE